MANLLYAFYGDDFTGSTDVLERLATGNVRAALFLQPPTEEDRSRLPGLQAIGIAGDSRSQTPASMMEKLPEIFRNIRDLGAPINHYKVCSTFDSSPQYGSIGKALEIGLEVCCPRFAPIVVGAPHLRRFVWQGNLFAADPLGDVHRIDRHPMSRHPVTPMREPNLRKHLAAQTELPIGEVKVAATLKDLRVALECELAAGCKAVVFDTVGADDLANVGRLLWDEAGRTPLFTIGSSGLTAALIGAWREYGLLDRQLTEPPESNAAASEKPGPLLVISGSCSAATARQLHWALAHGFVGVPLEPEKLLDEVSGQGLRAEIVQKVAKMLAQGTDTVVYTALGTPTSAAQGNALGAALGLLLNELLEHRHAGRVMLCGGDTSSQAVQQLDLRALTWKGHLQPGAPLCRAHADGPNDGLELVLKGGQMGTDDFFGVVRDATV